MFIVQFTVEDIPVGDVSVDKQQMERESHEVLHNLFFHFIFLYEFIYILIQF